MTQPTTFVPRSPARWPAAVPTALGAGLTHRGRVRSANEDAILTDPSGRLWAVADGMGGHEGGALASDLVIDTLAAIRDEDDPAEALDMALTEANARVRAAAAERGAGMMGATVVAVLIDQGIAHVAWAGDSRAYLLRGTRLRMLTHDHTVVQDLVDRGQLAAEAREHHPEAHVITRAVGAAPELEIDHAAVPLVPGDRLMLCSDGLPRCVYESVIEALLALAETATVAAEILIRRALEEGAPDNVSVIVVDLTGG